MEGREGFGEIFRLHHFITSDSPPKGLKRRFPSDEGSSIFAYRFLHCSSFFLPLRLRITNEWGMNYEEERTRVRSACKHPYGFGTHHHSTINKGEGIG
ncbi:uncharacterized protein G2W53_000405 [Senna tora]|uniref:Uncharacterized protein n=1 Tax=Senna tora TaxID=362788 RepID=A0A834XFG9_9FABA|nr:uncharacterized protein G2W53_000405 [Senna tora]